MTGSVGATQGFFAFSPENIFLDPQHGIHFNGRFGEFSSPSCPCTMRLACTPLIVETDRFQARERNPNPNFLVRIFSGGVGVFHVKGWGPKSLICPSKPEKSNFFGGISRDFAGISRKCPKSLRKKSLCSIFGPYIYVQFSKTSPLKSEESSGKSSGENRVKSCHVCGSHGFFGPESPLF